MGSEIRSRITSRTPKWFQAIATAGMVMVAVGLAILSAETMLDEFALVEWLKVVSQYLVVAGLAASAVAKTAKSNE